MEDSSKPPMSTLSTPTTDGDTSVISGREITSCLCCGKALTARQIRRSGRYCSKNCWSTSGEMTVRLAKARQNRTSEGLSRGGIRRWAASKILRFCPNCGISMDGRSVNRRYCSRLCWNVSEERRKKMQVAHSDGRMAGVYAAASAYGKLHRDTARELAAETTRKNREAGYPWLRGERNPMNRLGPEERAALTSNHSDKMKKYWTDPEWVMRHLTKAGRPPNKFENRLIQFFAATSLPFRFVGDWSFWRGPGPSGKCRNPDFIHSTKGVRRVILAHGRYWHSDLAAVQAELEDYAALGWEALIIWDDDRLDEQLARRITLFASHGLEASHMSDASESST